MIIRLIAHALPLEGVVTVMRSKEVSNTPGHGGFQPLYNSPPRIPAILGTVCESVHVTKEQVVGEVASVAETCPLQTVRVTCSKFRCSRLRMFAADDSNSPADHIARA